MHGQHPDADAALPRAEKLAERLIDEYEDSASGKIPFDKRYGLTFGGKEKDEPLEMCG